MDTVIAWFESLGIGTWYLRLYLLWGGGLLTAAVLGWWFRRRMSRGARAALLVALILATVRVAVFDNPVSLRLMQRLVTIDSIGGRQWGVLDLDIRKYARRLREPEVPNLAVGSSQVGAIFSHWVGDPSEPLELFSLAGMKTMDYELYREEIAARNPARVILYLSAFDLMAAPELYSWPLAPAHPLRMSAMIARVRSSSGLPADAVSGPAHDYIASQLLPEYRYRFVFGGFLKQLEKATAVTMAQSWLTATLLAADLAQETPTASAPTADAAKVVQLLSYFLPEYLDYNMGFLRSFVEYCRARGIEVVIVEGQVSPEVSGPKLALFESLVRSRFAELAMLYANVRVVEARETYAFTVSDYSDLTHVRPEAARRYTAHLSGVLGRASAPFTAPCDVTFGAGWHGREGEGDDWLRWSAGTGRLRLRVRESGTYVLRTKVLSLVRPNAIAVHVDDQERERWTIRDMGWVFHPMPPLELSLRAGETASLQFVSESAPITQSTDPRPLSIALRELTLTAPDGTRCAINQR
jgi:hypothetical protein